MTPTLTPEQARAEHEKKQAFRRFNARVLEPGSMIFMLIVLSFRTDFSISGTMVLVRGAAEDSAMTGKTDSPSRRNASRMASSGTASTASSSAVGVAPVARLMTVRSALRAA